MSQTEPMTGAEALLELFRIQGTDYIFCSPIAAWAPLWEALAKRKATRNIETPKYFNCRRSFLFSTKRATPLTDIKRPNPASAMNHQACQKCCCTTSSSPDALLVHVPSLPPAWAYNMVLASFYWYRPLARTLLPAIFICN